MKIEKFTLFDLQKSPDKKDIINIRKRKGEDLPWVIDKIYDGTSHT